MAKPPRITVKLRYDKKVRSFAKKTFGSTRVGIAMRFPGPDWRRGCEDIFCYLDFAWIWGVRGTEEEGRELPGRGMNMLGI